MHSSTPRAVMLSTLTTIGAFAALSLSPHQGTASVGILLATAVGLLLGLGILWLEFGSVEETFTVFHPEPVPESMTQ